VLELENTLLMTKRLDSQVKMFGTNTQHRKPDFEKDMIGIYFRRERETLLETIFKRVRTFYKTNLNIEYAVWTSLDRRSAEMATRIYFGPYFEK
jgi:hypothetical protein